MLDERFSSSGLRWMGGSWFRIRQILFIGLVVCTLLLMLKVFTSDEHFDAKAYEAFQNFEEEPVALRLEVIGSDQKGSISKNGKPKQVLADMSCRIPHLDINASEVIGFFKKPPPLTCPGAKNWAYIDHNQKLALIEEKKGAKCFGRAFTRRSDEMLTFADAVPLTEGAPLPSDFLHISCEKDSTQWKGLLMGVVPSEKRIEQLKSMKQPADWSGLSVFMLGFDSLSQLSFRRTLPKTVKFLEETLGSVVLNGYNIVGDGTPQAFIPILTAQTEVELPLTRKRFKNANYVDDVYPFVWRNFSNAGYATIYAEDAANIGTFTYRLKGFRNQPTDHYTRTFFQEAEKRLKSMKCLGSEPLHKSWLRYSREFMSSYKDVPRFLLMHHSELSHDDINLVSVIDDDLSSHLRSMHEAKAFDNTVVIVMADHGHRFAKLRETHQGQLEERLPFFSVALPKSFCESPRGKQACANLLENKERLSTPFDIHATFMDILHMPDDLSQQKQGRSLSLFRPIPSARTCEQAGVEPHWCTCLNWQNAFVTDNDVKEVTQIARGIVQTLNAQTKPERKLCAPLRLKKIHDAKKLVPNDDLLKYKNVKDADGFVPDLSGNTKASFAHYQIKLETSPGNAIYEATVFYTSAERALIVDLTAISHVNPFGDTPHCIIDKNYFLATYCVCYDKV